MAMDRNAATAGRERTSRWSSWRAATVLACLAAPPTLMLNFQPADRDEPDTSLADHELPGQAHAILQTHCYRCHGQGGSVEGGFNVVLSRQRLVALKYVVPGDAAASPLLKRLDHGTPPDAAQAAILRQWIDAGAGDAAPSARRRFITPEQTLSWIAADLRRAAPDERPHMRYLTLTHLANAGCCDDELRTYRSAVANTFCNGTASSWRKEPQPLDLSGTVLRLDLRDYDWSPADWELFATADPFALQSVGGVATEIHQLSQSSLAYLRADWLVWRGRGVALSEAKHPSGDPGSYVAERFQRPLDLTHVAAELGLETADLRVRVSHASSAISDLLSPALIPGGSISRNAFAESFGSISAGLGLGNPRNNAAPNDRHLEITRRPK